MKEFQQRRGSTLAGPKPRTLLLLMRTCSTQLQTPVAAANIAGEAGGGRGSYVIETPQRQPFAVHLHHTRLSIHVDSVACEHDELRIGGAGESRGETCDQPAIGVKPSMEHSVAAGVRRTRATRA